MIVTTANRVQGGLFTLMVVRISDPYDPVLDQELAEQVALSPGFYNGAPVVLDLKDCLGCTSVADYTVLRQVLRRHQLIPVGVQNASALQLRAAQAVDLAAFGGGPGGQRRAERPPARSPSSRPEPPRVEDLRAESARVGAAAAAAEPRSRTRIVTQPVRSGTQIYARGSDLIIVAPVSSGAEVIADGHIHVYGALRGRAIAGAAGDTAARIFAHRLDAELVSIAGQYLVSEAIAAEHRKQSVQVALIDDRIQILGWAKETERPA